MSKYAQGDVVGHQFIAQATIPAVAAGTATIVYPIFVADRDVRIKAVTFVPQAAVTGDNTNRKNLNLHNRGADGTGTTELANIDLATGTNLVALDETSLYAPASPLSISAGIVLAVQVEQVASGVALPQLHVQVTYDLQ